MAPPKIYDSPFPTFPLVERSILTHIWAPLSPKYVGNFPGSAVAYIDAPTGTSLTRADVKRLALCLAHGLLHRPDVALTRGDTVLIFSSNSLAWPVLVYGAIAAGLRCTLANSSYTSQELAYQFVDSSAKLIITSAEGLPVVREMFQSLEFDPSQSVKRMVVLGECLKWAGGPSSPRSYGNLLTMEDLLVTGSLVEEARFDGKQAQETVYICYSSGTTGRFKGVETTHQNCTTVLDSVLNSFDRLHPGYDCVLGLLPFTHIYGAVKLLLFPFYCGIPVAIQKRFEPDQFCHDIQRYRATLSFIVPPVLVTLARHPAVDEYDMSSLRILLSGAAPLGASLVRQVRQRLAALCPRLVISQGYGLTETSPTTHMLLLTNADRKSGSIGSLLANLQARIVLDEDGHVDANEGEPGELWIKGHTVMKGYLNNSAATADAVQNGWFKTGDIAIRDREGYYYIVDRRKELIKYKGFQVAPAELESMLLTHPDIADAAVIGVESTKEATELPRAYVVHAKPEGIDKRKFGEQVQLWAEKLVAKHKRLRGGVVVIEVIPKSPSGKILRRELRDLARKELLSSKL